jgi:phosphatidylinositol alpha-mannosyltransferase
VRVALVCPYSLSVPGGVQAQVLALAQAFRGGGHEAQVLAPWDGPPPEADNVIAVGRSIRVRVNGSVASMAPLPGPLLRAALALQRGRFDVIHLHEPLAPSITIAALACHAAPVVGTFHAAGDRTPYRWLGPLLKPLAARIDWRVAVSEPAKRLAHRYLGGSYEVLFNGIDVNRYDSVAARAVEVPTILFLGRHEVRKGLDVLLEAMAALPADVRLWVGGDGPETVRLRRRYGGDRRVEWLGRLSEDDKIARLRSASVVCIPSLHAESFGVALLEAMAAQTPVVASDLPGYRHLGGGGGALLIPPGEPRSLAAALSKVLRDSALADNLGELGRWRARDFDIGELARQYIEIYQRLT